MSVHADYVRSGVDRLSGSLIPGLSHVSRYPDGHDQSRVRGDSLDVPRSVLSPSALLFPLFDSGFASLSTPLSSSVALASLPSSFPSLPSSSSALSSSRGLPSVAPSMPSSVVPLFSLPSVVPSVLSFSSAAPLPPPPQVCPSLSLPGSSALSSALFAAPQSSPRFSAPSAVYMFLFRLLLLFLLFLLLFLPLLPRLLSWISLPTRRILWVFLLSISRWRIGFFSRGGC